MESFNNLSSLFTYTNEIINNYDNTINKLKLKYIEKRQDVQFNQIDTYICGSLYLIKNNNITGGSFSNNLSGGNNTIDIIKTLLCIIGAITLYHIVYESEVSKIDEIIEINHEKLLIESRYDYDPEEAEFQQAIADAMRGLKYLIDMYIAYKNQTTTKKRKRKTKKGKKVKKTSKKKRYKK